MTIVRIDDSLDGETFDIPDAAPSVRITRLRSERPSRASTTVVRFPKGFARPRSGWYQSAEEIVVLSGELTISGVAFRAGDWGFIEAGAVRRDTRALSDVVALARFAGRARWIAGEQAIESPPPEHRTLAAPPDPLLLHSENNVTSWFTSAPEEGVPAAFDTELLSLGSPSWAWVPAGSAFPRLDSPCFWRTFSPA